MAHRPEDKITETAEGENKEFKGPGIEGKKDARPTKEEKKAKKEAKAAERKARHKELGKKLGNLKARHKELLKEEEDGIMTGHVVIARKTRLTEIENCEAEIKALGKKR